MLPQFLPQITVVIYKMDIRPHPYWVRSDVHGLSHGLKIARQLSIFTPVCALVPPFQVRVSAKKTTPFGVVFLAGALGLEPRAYGFGVVDPLF